MEVIMTDFENELKEKLINELKLFDIDKDTITRETRFFGEGLGLDSIDALEIDYLVEKEYGIRILTSERSESTFSNFGSLADFIQKNRNRDLEAIKQGLPRTE
jgi:acyl carrier protein